MIHAENLPRRLEQAKRTLVAKVEEEATKICESIFIAKGPVKVHQLVGYNLETRGLKLLSSL
jgi:hypothetical protein